MKNIITSAFTALFFCCVYSITAQTCPDELLNEDTSVTIDAGNANGLPPNTIITGTTSDTNGSACSLELNKTYSGSSGVWSGYIYHVELQSTANNILEGDVIEFSLDGKGVTGNARVSVRYNIASIPRPVEHTFGQSNTWSTHGVQFTIPAGVTAFDIWLFPNSGSSQPGISRYDNLIVKNLTNPGSNNNGDGNNGGDDGGDPGTTGGYWTQTGSNIHYTEGKVGIGTTNLGNYELSVNGEIRAKEIKVETGWADYVFFKDYKLPTLEEVEQHIEEKGHLINIPSAKEVEANGIELGKMNKLLLEKIEELTLYIIQQQKEIQELKNRK